MSSPSANPGAPAAGSGEMFDAIAGRYDLVNRILSLGIDQSWRRRAIASLALPEAPRVLDLATGTGDVALAVLRRHPDASIEGIDPSTRMLEIAERKAKAAGVGFVPAAGAATRGWFRPRPGNAMDLPFPNASFDGVTIAFGIRNVPDRPRALKEMGRVTKPGGRIAILELTEPRGRVLGPLARWHIHRVVPKLGAWLSGAREYEYLQHSIARFPDSGTFAKIMRESGLEVIEARPLTFGVATLFLARPGDAR